MPYLNADYLIVYAFLLMTLIIGLRVGRGIKNIRACALANKQSGTNGPDLSGYDDRWSIRSPWRGCELTQKAY